MALPDVDSRVLNELQRMFDISSESFEQLGHMFVYHGRYLLRPEHPPATLFVPSAVITRDPKALAEIRQEFGKLYDHTSSSLAQPLGLEHNGPLRDWPALAMERLPRKLSDADIRSLDVETRLDIIENILSGLRDLHGMGLVHGGLVPEAVELAESDAHLPRARLARFVLPSKRSGAVLPEAPRYGVSLAIEGNQTKGGDLRAAGMIACELLAGRAEVDDSFLTSSFGSIEERWLNWHRDPISPIPEIASLLPDGVPVQIGAVITRLIRSGSDSEEAYADTAIAFNAFRLARGRDEYGHTPVYTRRRLVQAWLWDLTRVRQPVSNVKTAIAAAFALVAIFIIGYSIYTDHAAKQQAKAVCEDVAVELEALNDRSVETDFTVIAYRNTSAFGQVRRTLDGDYTKAQVEKDWARWEDSCRTMLALGKVAEPEAEAQAAGNGQERARARALAAGVDPDIARAGSTEAASDPRAGAQALSDALAAVLAVAVGSAEDAEEALTAAQSDLRKNRAEAAGERFGDAKTAFVQSTRAWGRSVSVAAHLEAARAVETLTVSLGDEATQVAQEGNRLRDEGARLLQAGDFPGAQAKFEEAAVSYDSALRDASQRAAADAQHIAQRWRDMADERSVDTAGAAQIAEADQAYEGGDFAAAEERYEAATITIRTAVLEAADASVQRLERAWSRVVEVPSLDADARYAESATIAAEAAGTAASALADSRFTDAVRDFDSAQQAYRELLATVVSDAAAVHRAAFEAIRTQLSETLPTDILERGESLSDALSAFDAGRTEAPEQSAQLVGAAYEAARTYRRLARDAVDDAAAHLAEQSKRLGASTPDVEVDMRDLSERREAASRIESAADATPILADLLQNYRRVSAQIQDMLSICEVDGIDLELTFVKGAADAEPFCIMSSPMGTASAKALLTLAPQGAQSLQQALRIDRADRLGRLQYVPLNTAQDFAQSISRALDTPFCLPTDEDLQRAIAELGIETVFGSGKTFAEWTRSRCGDTNALGSFLVREYEPGIANTSCLLRIMAKAGLGFRFVRSNQCPRQ